MGAVDTHISSAVEPAFTSLIVYFWPVKSWNYGIVRNVFASGETFRNTKVLSDTLHIDCICDRMITQQAIECSC